MMDIHTFTTAALMGLALAVVSAHDVKADTNTTAYISIGAGYHSSDMDNPEVYLDEFIGVFEIGYTIQNIDIRYSHYSGINQRESGYGFNPVTISYRIEF